MDSLFVGYYDPLFTMKRNPLHTKLLGNGNRYARTFLTNERFSRTFSCPRTLSLPANTTSSTFLAPDGCSTSLLHLWLRPLSSDLIGEMVRPSRRTSTTILRVPSLLRRSRMRINLESVLEDSARANPDARIRPLTHVSVDRAFQAESVGGNSLVTILIAIRRSPNL